MIFHFHVTFRLVQGPIQPHIQWVPGAFSVTEKWLQHKKSDNSPPPGARIKSNCSKAVPPCMYHCYMHKETSPFSLLAVCM